MDHELLVSPHDNIAAVAADNDAVECIDYWYWSFNHCCEAKYQLTTPIYSRRLYNDVFVLRKQ